MNLRPTPVNVRSEAVNLRPINVNVRSEAVNVRSSLVNVRPSVVNLQSARVNLRPARVNVRSAGVNVRRSPSDVRIGADYLHRIRSVRQTARLTRLAKNRAGIVFPSARLLQNQLFAQKLKEFHVINFPL